MQKLLLAVSVTPNEFHIEMEVENHGRYSLY